MLAFLLALQVVRPPDPCDDLELVADEYAAAEQFDAEIAIRTTLATCADREVSDLYNLSVALLDAGYPATPWLYEVAARTPPWDPVLPLTLDMLAEDADADEAVILRAHSDALKELAHGQDAAAQGSPPNPP